MDDENDNAPTFSKPWYSGHVREDCHVGCTIAMDEPILVTDADTGSNAAFLVTLLGDTSRLFVLEPSGYLTLAGKLDRELKDKHVLRVLATDKGEYSLRLRSDFEKFNSKAT